MPTILAHFLPPHVRSRRAAIVFAAALLVLLCAGIGPSDAEQSRVAASREAQAPDWAWAAQQSALCTVALSQAEQRYHLPPSLLASIARAESGRPIDSSSKIGPWPWTIDADGTGLFLDSKAAAIAWVRAQESRHSFIDVGCMQVDLHYHPGAFTSIEAAFDPAANVDYAARLLLELYRGEAGGSWDIAVGLYHSHTPLLAAVYRDRVAMIGSDVLHGVLRDVPLYVRAFRQGTLRLPLGGGRVELINVRRQPAIRARHPFTACQIVRFLGPYLNNARRSAACQEAAR